MTPKISIHTTMKPSMPRAFRSLRTYPALLLSGALSLGFLVFTGPAAHAARASGVAPSSEAPQLVATLQRPDATPFEKARACQQLAIVGDHQAVPALAALLPDPQLGAFARDALENIAHPSAGEALRNAVRQLQGAALVGVVHSLGARGELASVDALVALVDNPSAGVAPAALIALSHIDSEKVSRTLTDAIGSSSAEIRTAAAEGLLRCAERQLSRQRHRQAEPLFDAVRAASVSEPHRMAATRGAILAGGVGRIPLILELLRSERPDQRTLGAQVAREIPGDKVSQALANELRSSPPEVQEALIRALADRNATVARGRVEELAASPNDAVRQASLKALGSIGGIPSLPILIAGVIQDDPAFHSTASESLRRIRARKADAAIVEALPHASPQGRARLIAVLGDRNATSTAEELLRQTTDAHPEVAKAAFDALAVVASPRNLEGLIQAAATANDPVLREKAERALYSTCIKIADPSRRSDALARAYSQGGTTEARASLLQVMAMLGDATAYKTVAAAYQDPNSGLRDTTFQLLVNWPDATPVPLLLETFNETPDMTDRIVALRGIVTLATLWTDSPEHAANPKAPPPPQAVAWLRDANAALRNDTEEKRTILSGLATLNSTEGLRLLEPYLADPNVRRDAQLAYLRAARRLGTTEDRRLAQPVVQRIASEAADANVQRQAEETLKSMGDAPR